MSATLWHIPIQLQLAAGSRLRKNHTWLTSLSHCSRDSALPPRLTNSIRCRIMPIHPDHWLFSPPFAAVIRLVVSQRIFTEDIVFLERHFIICRYKKGCVIVTVWTGCSSARPSSEPISNSPASTNTISGTMAGLNLRGRFWRGGRRRLRFDWRFCFSLCHNRRGSSPAAPEPMLRFPSVSNNLGVKSWGVFSFSRIRSFNDGFVYRWSHYCSCQSAFPDNAI